MVPKKWFDQFSRHFRPFLEEIFVDPPLKNIMFANSVIYKCHQYDDQFYGTFGKENKPMFVWDRPYISRCKIKSEMLWSDFYQITWNEYLLILERDDENKITEQIPSKWPLEESAKYAFVELSVPVLHICLCFSLLQFCHRYLQLLKYFSFFSW